MNEVKTKEEALEVIKEVARKRNEIKELLNVMKDDDNNEFFGKYRRKIELIEVIDKELDVEVLSILGSMKMELASSNSDLMTMHQDEKYYYEVGLDGAVKITRSFSEAVKTYQESNGLYLLRRHYTSSNGRICKIQDKYNFDEKVFERIEEE